MSALAILRSSFNPEDTSIQVPGAAGPSVGPRRIVPISVSGDLFYMHDKVYPSNHSLIREIEKNYHFEQGSFERIFTILGQGNARAGTNRFELLAQTGAITIERVGFRKEHQGAEEKYYLMINKSDQVGGNNQFHKGFSRRGTQRAITRPLHMDISHAALNAIQQGLSHAIALSKRHNEPSQAGFARIMNAEGGIKVSELGAEDLTELLNQEIPNEGEGIPTNQRLKIYEGIDLGLQWIHDHKLVHRDLKLDNVVIIRRQDRHINHMSNPETNDPREIIGAKIIDHDFLTEEGTVSAVHCGTPLYYSPKLIIQYVLNQGRMAHFTNDAWAFMYMICRIEAIIAAHNPCNCLLSESTIKRFEEYQNNIQDLDFEENPNYKGYYSRLKKMMQQNGADLTQTRHNLFIGITPSNDFERYVFSKAEFSLPKILPRTSRQHQKSTAAPKIGQSSEQAKEKPASTPQPEGTPKSPSELGSNNS